MRLNTLLVTTGIVVCGGLGIALLQVRTESHALAAERTRTLAENRRLESTVASMNAELTKATAAVARAREQTAAGRLAPEQVRALIAPVLAAITAEHMAHPPMPRQPPPPVGRMGMQFPELMGDPEYNLLQKQWEKVMIAQQYRTRLENAGVAAKTIDRVLDLLAEREMVRMDYQSLRDQFRTGTDVYIRQQADQHRIDAQIKAALGPELYDKLASNVPETTLTLQPDGRVRPTTTYRRQIVGYEPPDMVQYAMHPLEIRLSYSAEPLTPTQIAQLTSVLSAQSAAGSRYFTEPGLWVPNISSVLSPAQQAAADELTAEHDASVARSRLPRS